NVFPGVAVDLPDAAASALRANPRVTRVEADGVATIDATQSSPPWGVDRTDQRDLPLNQSYTYDASGAGVDVYIVDTGVRATHVDLAGRVVSGYTAYSGGTDDCHGHGTHVAGTAAGNTYGLAKSANIIPVRVLDCAGSGSYSVIIAGLDWIISHHVVGKPAVANMSLGGGASTQLNDAVRKTHNDGVTMVVAAGNSNANACNYSPASAPEAITVGSTTSTDARSSFSNFGSCLDIFAPGSSITSASYASDTGTATMSGTSMASPHVAGAAAVLMSGGYMTPADVTTALIAQSTPGKVTSAGTNSPNRLLYLGTDTGGGGGGGVEPPPPPPPATAPAAPTNVTASASRRAANVSWTQGSNGGAALTKQVLRVYLNNSLFGNPLDVSPTATSVKVSLPSGGGYRFTVQAINSVGSSPESTPSNLINIR
ncbi:MAG: S8 family serine peptidase, partial [Ilumatobacteraceae bacterium]